MAFLAPSIETLCKKTNPAYNAFYMSAGSSPVRITFRAALHAAFAFFVIDIILCNQLLSCFLS